MRSVWTRRLGIILAMVFAVDCVVETWGHRFDGVGYWFGTTFAATVLVLAGSLRRWSNPFIGAILVAIGAAVGLLPTAWTIVVPLFAIGVVALTIVDAGLTVDGR